MHVSILGCSPYIGGKLPKVRSRYCSYGQMQRGRNVRNDLFPQCTTGIWANFSFPMLYPHTPIGNSANLDPTFVKKIRQIKISGGLCFNTALYHTARKHIATTLAMNCQPHYP